jgi:hypothetical protein
MPVKRRTILMSEDKLLEALRLGWINQTDLNAEEFLFYFVPAAEPWGGTAIPAGLERIYEAAAKETPPRFAFDKATVPSAFDLAKFLKAHNIEGATDTVLKIFDGWAWRLIDDFYKRTPNLRVLGPKDAWSGFNARWVAGYANRGSTL